MVHCHFAGGLPWCTLVSHSESLMDSRQPCMAMRGNALLRSAQQPEILSERDSELLKVALGMSAFVYF